MNDIEFERLLKTAVVKAAELDYMSDMPSEEELSRIIKPSVAFEKKMTRLINSPTAYIKKLRRPLYVKALRTVASIFIVISIMFSLSMLNPVARARFVALVRSWFDDHTEYAIIDDSSSSIPDTAILDYIPEGFNLSFEAYNPISLNLSYQSDNGWYFDIEILEDSNLLHLDNEHAVFYTIIVDDYDVDVYESNDENYPSTLVCYDEDNSLIVCITGMVSIDELSKIIANISY